MRKLAISKELKVNEYDVFNKNRRIAGKTENEIFNKLNLDNIDPKLLEDRGEIEAAQKGKHPTLVELKDIRGDLHCHTYETDGNDGLETMIKKAIDLGYNYIAITDHSKHLTIANGFDEKRLRKQIENIDRLNEKYPKIIILKSIESDILEDRKLDLPNRILKVLEVRVCSIHYQFSLPSKKTERIIKAMDNPYFNILAHPQREINS